MLRTGFKLILVLWVLVLVVTGSLKFIVSMLPSQGTALITYNIFLNRYERFQLVDLHTKLTYSFSPSFAYDDETFAILLSPTTQRMVTFGYYDDNTFGIRVLDLRGYELVDPIPFQYTNIIADTSHWSNDGQTVIFPARIAGDRFGLFELDTNTGALNRLFNQTTDYPGVAWSPDNTQIVYSDNDTNDISQIWLADHTGENTRQLTQNDNPSYCVTWSPDGRTLAYTEDLTGTDQLRYLDMESQDTSNRIEKAWNMTTCPLWLGDSRHLIFVSLDIVSYRTNIVIFDTLTGQEQSLIGVEQTANLDLWD